MIGRSMAEISYAGLLQSLWLHDLVHYSLVFISQHLWQRPPWWAFRCNLCDCIFFTSLTWLIQSPPVMEFVHCDCKKSLSTIHPTVSSFLNWFLLPSWPQNFRHNLCAASWHSNFYLSADSLFQYLGNFWWMHIPVFAGYAWLHKRPSSPVVAGHAWLCQPVGGEANTVLVIAACRW